MDRKNDCMSLYLRDIRKNKILTQCQEIELAKKIKQGDKLAEKKLVESNLKFVISTARKYQHLGLPLEDLISEGNLGLIKAAKRFDESKGYKFISYAVWWIKQSILLSINENCSTIRIPMNVRNDMVKQTKDAENFNEPIDDNDLIYMKIPRITSLNKLINENGNELSVILVDEIPYPDQQIIDVELTLKNALDSTMSCLNDREKKIVINYFGLGDTGSKTLEDIGYDLSLTKERVRQIKDKAIQKLRHNSEPLFNFFE